MKRCPEQYVTGLRSMGKDDEEERVLRGNTNRQHDNEVRKAEAAAKDPLSPSDVLHRKKTERINFVIYSSLQG